MLNDPHHILAERWQGVELAEVILGLLDSSTDSWAFETWSDDVWTMLEQAFGEMREIDIVLYWQYVYEHLLMVLT